MNTPKTSCDCIGTDAEDSFCRAFYERDLKQQENLEHFESLRDRAVPGTTIWTVDL